MLTKRFILIILVTGLFAFGLAHLYSREPNPERNYAIAVAEQEAKKRGWKGFKVDHVAFREGSWWITITRLPKVPDGYRTFEISIDTKVTPYGGT